MDLSEKEKLERSCSVIEHVDWTNIIFFAAINLTALVGGIVYIAMVGLSWFPVTIFLTMLAATLMSITSGYHRLYAHRSYDCATWLKVFYLLFGAAAFQESCMKWSVLHRIHHRFTDQKEDPYNIKKGFWWAHVGWILFGHHDDVQYPQDLLDDKYVVWQKKYWLTIAIVMCFGFPTLVGLLFGYPLEGFLFGGVIRLVVAHHFTFMINSLAHTIGSQKYSLESSSGDSTLTAFLTFGEGYHNYHHWYARDYRNGIRFWHYDPGKWFIFAMNKIGQAWDLKRAPEEVILRAMLQVQRQQVAPAIAPALRLRFDQAFERMTESLDELGKRRKAWVEAKQIQKSEFDAKVRAQLRDQYREAKQQYREFQKWWKQMLREMGLPQVAP